MLKIRSYLLIAFVVYSTTLLSALPASLVIEPIAKRIGNNFQVDQTSGTVWKGQASGALNNEFFDFTWDLHLLKMLLLNIAADVHLKSTLLEAKTTISFSYKSLEITALSGVMKANAINAMLVKEDVLAAIESDIYLKKITLKRANAQFKEATGQVDWEGGLVKVKELPNGRISLPPLLANMSLDDLGILLSVVIKEQGASELLSIHLAHDGKAHLQLKERVAEYVDVPKQLKTGNPESIMFEIKRQLFETQGRF